MKNVKLWKIQIVNLKKNNKLMNTLNLNKACKQQWKRNYLLTELNQYSTQWFSKKLKVYEMRKTQVKIKNPVGLGL